jgi:mannose-1-phosphate guanylyltransferase
MRAILLAAGFGTRLRPITNNIPKCLVPIQGKPLLLDWLERLHDAGVGPFLINTHYLSEKVVDFIEKSRHRNEVTIVHEHALKGTAGTLISNQNFFDNDDGLLIHADNYCTENFSKFIGVHNSRPKECLITMMVFKTNEPSSCGIVEVDSRGVVINFHEKVKTPPSNLANGAVYILSKEFIKMLDKNFPNAKDFSSDILPKILNRIYTYNVEGIFLDIGTPNNYHKVGGDLSQIADDTNV